MGFEPWISRAPGAHRHRRRARRTTTIATAQPDKLAGGRRRRSTGRVPYWHVDAGAAMMLLLLAAVDEGLGGGRLRRAGDVDDRCWELLGIPDDVAAGRASSRSASRRPRPRSEGSRKEAIRAVGSRSTRSSAGSAGAESASPAARIGDTFNQYRGSSAPP